MKIKDKIKVLVAGLAVVAGTVFMGLTTPVNADSNLVLCSDGKTWAATYEACNSGGAIGEAEDRTLFKTVKDVINVALGILAFITVLMIIIGGLNYTTSQGDATKVKKAKDTIMYGVIGLVIALLAFAIVNFVLANLFG